MGRGRRRSENFLAASLAQNAQTGWQQGRSRWKHRRRLFSPTHPELPRQLVSQVGYVEDAFEARTKLAACLSILLIQRGVERHIRIMPKVVAKGAHYVRPDTCGILVEDSVGICRNGKPGSGLHF